MTSSPISVSLEFFPPKTEAGNQKLWEVARNLAPLRPQFASVTCGAGGSPIAHTADIVRGIQTQIGFEAAPHIAIGRETRSHVRSALQDYKKSGVRRVVAVRGDAAPGQDERPADDIYPNTIDFVYDLRHNFGLEPVVAAYPDVHPRAFSPQQDLDHLKRKEDAGAGFAISQFFFEAETFLRFRDKARAAGIRLPLSPGLIPIHQIGKVIEFAKACGTSIPQGFTERFERHGEDTDAHFNEAVEHATALCERLSSEGVGHFHFYTLNRSDLTLAVCKNLSLFNDAQNSTETTGG